MFLCRRTSYHLFPHSLNYFCNLFLSRVFNDIMTSEEDCALTPEMEAEATDRNDDFGRLVAHAFTFTLPPFPFATGYPVFQPEGGV